MLSQESQFFDELLGKHQSDRLQFLMQAQVNALTAKGLKNLSKDERIKFSSFKKELTAFKNHKWERQQSELVVEKRETKKND